VTTDILEELQAAIHTVRSNPDHPEAWDEVEELASRSQRPEDVASLYEDVLRRDVEPALAEQVGQRAANFLEEWFGEESEVLIRVLTRVLEIDSSSEWAFQRLTVAHTVAGRWNDLLSLYDTTIAAAASPARRQALLDEAANVAKDFAQAPDRAIEYLTRLLELRPYDLQLVESLERLLERQERWRDLVEMWLARVDGMLPGDRRSQRLRIADCLLERLDEPRASLDQIETLLAEGCDGHDPIDLLERISRRDSATADIRRRALSLLQARYDLARRQGDAVKAVEAALDYVPAAEQAALHREAGERQIALAKHGEAMGHFASLLCLEPTAVDAHQRLRELAGRTGDNEGFARALEDAAESCGDVGTRVSLRLEAAATRRSVLSDADGAITLYHKVLDEREASASALLQACRRLSSLLETAGRASEQLGVLERLANLEPEPAERRVVLGRAANLADSQGEVDRSLRLWGKRIESDAADVEALNATAGILARESRWASLVEVLQKRAAAPVSARQSREDTVAVARLMAEKLQDIDGAIATWLEVQQRFGENDETIDALADLYARAGRWQDYADLLDGALERESNLVATMLTRLGDVCRNELDAPDRALGFYGRTLRIDPARAEALAGLAPMLDDPERRGTVADVLAKAYDTTSRWSDLIGLLEHRLETAPNDATRVRLLRETADVQEQRLHDPGGALGSLARAMVLAPWDASLEIDALGLAEQTGEWAAMITALGHTADAVAEDSRRLHLRLLTGRLAEERVGDPGLALEAYWAAHELAPSRIDSATATIRVAGTAGSWDRLAGAVIGCHAAVDDVVPAVIHATEEAASAHDAWAEVTLTLDAVLASAEDVRPGLARELDLIVARWFEERLDDLASAETALVRAADRDSESVTVLSELARVQRRSPDVRLYETLLRLGDRVASDDDLDPLHEAATLAIETLGDAALQVESLQRLHREASRLWRAGVETRGRCTAEGSARWALDELVRIFEDQREHGKAVTALAGAAQLPVAPAASREMRRRAARLAAGPLGDHGRAMVLYRGILAETSDDAETVRELSDVCRARGLSLELLSLLQQELGLCEDRDRRLEVRLEIADIIGQLETRGGRLEALKANLSEIPGHPPSIAALVKVHEDGQRFVELASLLTEQAALLEEADQGEAAAELWTKVASLAEERLRDTDRALNAHRHVQKLVGSVASLDALARLQIDRGEHAAAARWLERRLQATKGDERLVVFEKLSNAYLGAGQVKPAMETLEAALAEVPQTLHLREKLAAIYRKEESWEPLAQLLTETAPYIDDLEALRAYAHEAAGLYGRLGSPDKAISVLEKAASVAPEDHSIRRMLAEALIAAERLDEGRAMAEQLIADFGRRRNPDRAAVHYLLARALRAKGDNPGALEQLELASVMDVQNTGVARMLGQLAREVGELDRAERTYKKLLMVVRRLPPEHEVAVGAAEVLYELHRLAQERGEADQAEELLRSALQTASQTASEARRFRRAMLERNELDLCVKALEMRVGAAPAGEELAWALADQAAVLEIPLGRHEEALACRLLALEQAPDSWAIHDAVRDQACRLGQSEKYAAALRDLIDNTRREEEAHLASGLTLRLGKVLEADLGEYKRAAEAYSRVESYGVRSTEARVALSRVAGAQGNIAEEIRLLQSLIAAEDLTEAEKSDCRYRLAELQLSAEGTGGAGLATLEDALEADALYDRAAAILKRATTDAPDEDRRMRLYGKVARASGNEDVVLDYLEKRIRRPDGTLAEAEQTADILALRDEPGRLESVYRRASEIAVASEAGLAGALWAPLGVAEQRRAAGDLLESARWMARAAEGSPDDASAFDLWVKTAGLTAEGGEHARAFDIYIRLLERDPSDRRVWEPALRSARALGDEARLTALIATTLGALSTPAERNAVRFDHATFLLGLDGRESDAAAILRSILEEEPDHKEATDLLTTLYGRIGFDEDLAGLLRTKLDLARDAKDLEGIRDVTLRLGDLLVKIRREDAMGVYRQGLEWLPDDREIAQRLLDLLGPEDDPRERVELLERPLAREEGEAAASLALRLADEWAALSDDAGVERVLRRGYEACPENDAVRQRLEVWFSERGAWGPLAELMTSEARRLTDPVASVALLRNAAAIYRDSLDQIERCAESLALARTFAPDDINLISELAQQRGVAGQHAVAIEEVSEALSRFDEEHASRTDLLLLRADLRGAIGETAASVEDLEEAYRLSGTAVAPHLVAGLEQLKAGAFGRDPTVDRSSTLRLVSVLLETGEFLRARDILTVWLSGAPDDREALYQLLRLEENEERWEDVASLCERLIPLEMGEAQVEAVIQLHDACQRIGQPQRARVGLERVHQDQPAVTDVRDRLWQLYEAMGANQELASMLVAEALLTQSPEARFEQLRRAGRLFLDSGPDGLEQAIAPLQEAVELNPEDHDSLILLVDAYTSTGRYPEAGRLLEQAISARGTRRSRQLAELQHRMARLAGIAGDKPLQLQWLNVAFDSDRRNGDVVADLAGLAMELNEHELALSALRVVTVSKVDSPLSRARAFLMQAQIAHMKGESRRALMWAHRAHEEDPELVEASQFLEVLSGES
jgi:tetratricopeptide (TPR) repeat protein